MATRYFIADMITRVVDGETQRDPAIVQYAFPQYSSLVTLSNETEEWALVKVVHPMAVPIPSITGVDALPDLTIDAKIATMSTAKQNAVNAALTARGLNASLILNADAYGEGLQRLGRKIDPAFNINEFGLAG